MRSAGIQCGDFLLYKCAAICITAVGIIGHVHSRFCVSICHFQSCNYAPWCRREKWRRALLMTANNSKTVFNRAPSFSLLPASYGGLVIQVKQALLVKSVHPCLHIGIWD